ncbi:phage tail protein [Aquirufa sp. OSTEICH-129A]
MTDNPNPGFYFKVEFGKLEMYFQEIAGLDFNNLESSENKKYDFIRLKKGIGANPELTQIFRQILLSENEITFKKLLKISLLDSNGKALSKWEFENSILVKSNYTPIELPSQNLPIELLVFTFTSFRRTK